jgi:hypothetical protein
LPPAVAAVFFFFFVVAPLFLLSDVGMLELERRNWWTEGASAASWGSPLSSEMLSPSPASASAPPPPFLRIMLIYSLTGVDSSIVWGFYGLFCR